MTEFFLLNLTSYYVSVNENVGILIQIAEIGYQLLSWRYVGICSVNGLARNRGQPIAWTNVDRIQWRHWATMDLNS